MKIIVLGAGLVGGPMVADLAREADFEISCADINSQSLEKLKRAHPSIRTIQQDLSSPDRVERLVSDSDIVLNAVPGFLGYQTLQSIIRSGKNVVDICFSAEDPFQLDDLAREKGVVALVDCGVAPGMSNVLIGYVHHQLDQTEQAEIYVGGLPQTRIWPWEYRAVFSPIDVIEEYTRPARLVENGQLVTRSALSEPEYLVFPEVGTLEAFNSDGLRTLAQTIPARNMKEKTLRYPGHIDKIKILREVGFFSKEPITVGSTTVCPLDVTAKLLFPLWKLEPGEIDLTVMRVLVKGVTNGQSVRYTYDLIDRYDPETQVHSMARTTGYTATVAVRMLAKGLYDRIGISPPEFIGQHKQCVEFLLKGLAERGVVYHETIERT
ncbi:saccharopine dehydrogenase NADP-binding domain-containing protein [bacterium]|nr:saccharopine dehydrogenase NADP-binding domain-containing protein [bacterium]